jgi:hypothetical protein
VLAELCLKRKTSATGPSRSHLSHPEGFSYFLSEKATEAGVHATCSSERRSTVTNGGLGSISEIARTDYPAAFVQVSSHSIAMMWSGRGRTADFRPFRITDHRTGLAIAFCLPAR